MVLIYCGNCSKKLRIGHYYGWKRKIIVGLIALPLKRKDLKPNFHLSGKPKFLILKCKFIAITHEVFLKIFFQEDKKIISDLN